MTVTAPTSTPCGICAIGADSPTAIVFNHEGVRHAAPEIWIVGRRVALEHDGLTPTEATGQACREWAALCASRRAPAASAAPDPVEALVSRAGWRWFGYGGHLCVGSRCAFHLATIVGGVLVSTIGHYIPKHGDDVEEIGSGRTFETMVFRCGGVDADGNPETNSSAIEATSYNDSRQAERGHYAICERWHQRQLQPQTEAL